MRDHSPGGDYCTYANFDFFNERKVIILEMCSPNIQIGFIRFSIKVRVRIHGWVVFEVTVMVKVQVRVKV
jgi:hypothetical protein